MATRIYCILKPIDPTIPTAPLNIGIFFQAPLVHLDYFCQNLISFPEENSWPSMSFHDPSTNQQHYIIAIEGLQIGSVKLEKILLGKTINARIVEHSKTLNSMIIFLIEDRYWSLGHKPSIMFPKLMTNVVFTNIEECQGMSGHLEVILTKWCRLR